MIFPVRSLFKYFLILTGFGFLTACAGSLILMVLKLNGSLPDLMILSVVFTFITIGAFLIFIRGQSRESQIQIMHTLVSLSIKFLLEMGLIILWFIVAKKTSIESVLIFFVLYLAFSLFLILLILKTLKSRSI